MAEEETQKDILEFEASKALEDITNQLQNQSSDEDDFDFEKDVTSEGKVIGKEPLTLNKEKREKKASEMTCEDELPGSRKEVTALATDVDVLVSTVMGSGLWPFGAGIMYGTRVPRSLLV